MNTSFIVKCFHRIKLSLHYRFFFAPGIASLYRAYQNHRIKNIRKKKQITVLFIIGEASTWKTEALYKKMLIHPRFNPILGVTESLQVYGSKDILIEYLRKRGYSFIDLDNPHQSIDKINPDIKIYYKPYELNYRHGLYFDYHIKSLVCQINYGLSASGGAVAFKHPIKEYAWREFVENASVINDIGLVGKPIINKVVTGLPMQDILSLPKDNFNDSWIKDGRKKRIIYAPHHSFKGCNGAFIEYATFLEFGEFVLLMAKKYASQVQWIFKPHPSLRIKLAEIWGKERTDEYYLEWERLPNAQVELGEYMGIFKHSDAMIHDCSSFLIEYQYTNNPVLFLETEHRTAEQMHLSEFGYEAYKAHYHALTKADIEHFICDVIDGHDSMAKVREDYYNKYLRLPNGKTACDNIIDVILGDNQH